jgi:Do/DeqQ family serine protease
MKRILLILTVITSAFVGAVLGIIYAVRYIDLGEKYTSIQERQKSILANYKPDSSLFKVPATLNFEAAAKAITPAVVHIRSIYGPGNFSLNPLENFANPHAQSTGSGVLISDDGYIVTNNHVIEDASTIEIVMNNNQRFYAKLIGRDPTTDLALLKIKGKNLPFVAYGNSDQVIPGEWVLAIGNPFDLNSTVTAGIVSAKARNIHILHEKNQLEVESFIQTDAAVNPGNSGGALVNLKGELIGINSAIATTTGSYSGYSFAIPINLAKKIMDDLLEFGQVQRGLLGVRIGDVTADLAEELKLDVVQGVFVSAVNKGSAAEDAGILEGDVIVGINNHDVNNVSEMQEWVARNRPGQSIEVSFRRNGITKKVNVRLKDFEGNSQAQKRETAYELGGALFEDLEHKDLTTHNLDAGVYLKTVNDGPWKKAGIKEGYIVTFIDKVPIEKVEDLNRVLELKHGAILVEGVYKSGERATFGFDWE